MLRKGVARDIGLAAGEGFPFQGFRPNRQFVLGPGSAPASQLDRGPHLG